MISIRSEDVSIIKDIHANFGYKKFHFKSLKELNSDAFTPRLARLCKKGLMNRKKESAKIGYLYWLTPLAKEILKENYILENKCVICGAIHDGFKKTCSDKCSSELSSRTQKALPYLDEKNHELIEQIENHIEKLGRPIYLSLQNFKYDLDLNQYEPRSLWRILYAVFDKKGYVQYSAGSVRRVYIRKDALQGNNTSGEEQCTET